MKSRSPLRTRDTIASRRNTKELVPPVQHAVRQGLDCRQLSLEARPDQQCWLLTARFPDRIERSGWQIRMKYLLLRTLFRKSSDFWRAKCQWIWLRMRGFFLFCETSQNYSSLVDVKNLSWLKIELAEVSVLERHKTQSCFHSRYPSLKFFKIFHRKSGGRQRAIPLYRIAM